jgi:hypothetical protein
MAFHSRLKTHSGIPESLQMAGIPGAADRSRWINELNFVRVR